MTPPQMTVGIRRPMFVLCVLALLAIAALCILPFVGMEAIPLGVLGDKNVTAAQSRIFWHLRIPRVGIAFIAGALLSASGMCFQSLFRNPLATPFTLGVASGASLGAAAYLALGLTFTAWVFSGITLFAFGGALLAITLVYGLTHARKNFSPGTMLLAGIAVSFFFSSLILFIQYLSDFTHSFRIIRWLMGGIDVAGYNAFFSLVPITVILITLVIGFSNELNLLAIGEDFARSRGVAAGIVKKALFAGVSLVVGGVVAFCGPISFVGLICPHMCRLIIGPNHRYLAPASFLFGGLFLVLCDTVARIVVAPAEIPVGVITSLLGGPFFLWLLLKGDAERAGI